jgi:hypothetical protein
MAVAKHKYIMDYISDKNTYKAVMYACKLIREYGKGYHDAVRIASNTYDVDANDIRHYMSQRSGRKC